MPRYDVFLSHATADKPVVERLAHKLREAGIHPFLDSWHLIPGRLWQPALEKALADSQSVAIFIGSEGIGPWERQEMLLALDWGAKNEEYPVIPVLLPGSTLQKEKTPNFLLQRTWVRFEGEDDEPAFHRLLVGIRSRPAGEGVFSLLDRTGTLGASLPACRNLPFDPLGDLFKGRDEELRRLAAGGREKVMGRKDVIFGFFGTGKTRLAVEYAWRYGSWYNALMFVRSESPEGLHTELANLARLDLLGLPEWGVQQAENAVQRWLKQSYGWLLILDGVDTMPVAGIVRELLPVLGNGHVLITSCLTDWPASLRSPVRLGAIALEEAASFLLERTAERRPPAADDVEQAARLAEALGELPLALEQASAYIAFQGTTFADYLEAWRSERQQLLAWHHGLVMDHVPLAVTWQKTFQRLGITSRTLLRLIAHFAPEPIPRQMLTRSSRLVKEAATLLDSAPDLPTQPVEAALEDLATYSVIALRGQEVSIHRLVQDVARALLPEERRQDWIQCSLDLVADFAPVAKADVRAAELFRPHAVRVIEHAESMGIREPTATLISQLAELLEAKGLLAEAEALYCRALELSEAILDPSSPDLAADLGRLAGLRMVLGRAAEAEPLYRRALELRETALGAAHPDLAFALNDLARLLTITGRPEEAESLYRRALEIDAAALGPEHPRVAVELGNLAALLRAAERLDEAEPLMRWELQIQETALGHDRPELALLLHDLASLLQTLGRSRDADPLLRRALKILESQTPDVPLVQEVRATLEQLPPPPAAPPSQALTRLFYVDFSLRLGPRQGEEMSVLVLRSPAGEARGSFPLGSGVAAHLGDLLGGGKADPREIGERLFRNLFAGDVERLFRRSLAVLEGEQRVRLRIEIHLDPFDPDVLEMSSLPWELLYDPERGEFLALRRHLSVVRFLDVPRSPQPVRIDTTLRILVAVFRTRIAALDLLQERYRLQETLGKLPSASILFLDYATPQALREALLGHPAHVLHLVGHGAMDVEGGQEYLFLESEDGEVTKLGARNLAVLLRDCAALRLVFLHADVARSSRLEESDSFAEFALTLVRMGVPAVVRLHSAMAEEKAMAFSQAFYRRLAAGDPVDLAVGEGRLAVHLVDPESADWAAPVLFSSASAGKLFEVPAPVQIAGTLIRGQVFDFSRLIEDKTIGFVGRRWIFDALDRFLEENPRGYFVMQGSPGIGKSALLADLVRRRNYIHHFNVRAEGIQRPEMFLANVSAQLIVRYGPDYPFLPPEATRDAKFLEGLLGRISEGLRPGEKCVIVVDALDEADLSAHGMNPLYLPASLPSGIYFVVTSRRGEFDLRVDCEALFLDLEERSQDNIADLREYLENQLSLAGIRDYLAAQGLDAETFITEMVAKSEGNFMYLRYVLPEIERGTYIGINLGSLPVGLWSYYEEHWRRMRKGAGDTWFAEQLPVLVALSLVPEPISLDLIARFSGLSDLRRVQATLSELAPFLEVIENWDEEAQALQKLYRFYHASFSAFVAAKEMVADELGNLRAASRC